MMYELLATSGKYIIILISLLIIISVIILSAYQDKIMVSSNEVVEEYEEDELNDETEEDTEVYGSLIIKNILNNPKKMGQKIDLLSNLTIGREVQNDLWINDSMTSKYHAETFKKGNKFYIQDLNSTNGTYVDGKRIKKPTKIKNGSIIRIGTYEIKVQIF